MKGMHKRMGDTTKPDKAISLDILHAVMRLLEQNWEDNPHDRFALALEGYFYLIAFCWGLRGEEVPLSDLNGMLKHWDEGGQHSKPHVVVSLLGRFKGETGIGYHILPIIATTPSGLEPRKWIGRLLTLYRERGINHGPIFCNRLGHRINASDIEQKFLERLEMLQEARPDLIPDGIEVAEEYGIYRSFRRGSTSTAVNPRVKKRHY